MNRRVTAEYNYLFGSNPDAEPADVSWAESIAHLLRDFPLSCWSTIAVPQYLRVSSAVSGLNSINAMALPFLLKDAYHITPAGLSIITVAAAGPSFIKPFFALLADNYPISGLRRKPYLIIANCVEILAKVGFGVAANLGAPLPVIITFLVINSSSSALDATIRDTLMIEVSARNPTDGPALIADVAGLSVVSALSVSYFSGALLGFVTPGTLVASSAIFSAVNLYLSSRMFEDADAPRAPPLRIENLARTFSQSGGVLKSQASAVAVWSCVPSFHDAMFFYYTQKLHLHSEFFGRVRFLGNCAMLVANAAYRAIFKNFDQRTLSMTASGLTIPLMATVAILTTGHTESWLQMSPTTYIMVKHCLHDGLYTLASISNMVMLSKVAPRGSEGPFFAVYGNINDFGTLTNGAVSAVALHAYGITATNFDNLTKLIYTSAVMGAVSAPWSLWTPESVPQLVEPEEVHEEEELLLLNSTPELVH